MTDDWWWLEQAREGDESAWQTLFDRYYQDLVRMAFFITGSLESAQDIAQETFVNLLRANIRHYDGSLKAFLSTITYRLSLKERARLHARGKLDAHSIIDESPSVLESAVKDETDRLILCALRALDIEYREVLTLRFFGGHSYEEISQIMEIPIGTVKSRMFYGIKNCREKLKEQGVFA